MQEQVGGITWASAGGIAEGWCELSDLEDAECTEHPERKLPEPSGAQEQRTCLPLRQPPAVDTEQTQLWPVGRLDRPPPS